MNSEVSTARPTRRTTRTRPTVSYTIDSTSSSSRSRSTSVSSTSSSVVLSTLKNSKNTRNKKATKKSSTKRKRNSGSKSKNNNNESDYDPSTEHDEDFNPNDKNGRNKNSKANGALPQHINNIVNINLANFHQLGNLGGGSNLTNINFQMTPEMLKDMNPNQIQHLMMLKQAQQQQLNNNNMVHPKNFGIGSHPSLSKSSGRPKFELSNLGSKRSSDFSSINDPNKRQKQNNGSFRTMNPQKVQIMRMLPKDLKHSLISTKEKFLHKSHNPFWQMVEGFHAVGGDLNSDRSPGFSYPRNGYNGKKYQEHKKSFRLDRNLLMDIDKSSSEFKKSFQICLKIHDRSKPHSMIAPYGLDVKVNKVNQTLGHEIPVINNAQIPRLAPNMIEIARSTGFRETDLPCYIDITWRKYQGFPYTDLGFVIFVGKRCHIADAIKTIPSIPENKTEELIRSKFKSNDDSFDQGLTISEVKCNISCPLTLIKLTNYPVRFDNCKHIDCFDAEMYLKMNWKRPTSWKCPICQSVEAWESLRLCTWTRKVATETPEDEKEIYLTPEGGWKLPKPKKDVDDVSEYKRETKEEIDYDNASSTTNPNLTNPKIQWNSNRQSSNSSSNPKNSNNVETICLDSDSDTSLKDPLETSIITDKHKNIDSDSDSASYEGSEEECLNSDKEDPFKDFLADFEAANAHEKNNGDQSVSKSWGKMVNGQTDRDDKGEEETNNKIVSPEDFASAWDSGKGQKVGLFNQPLLGKDSPKNVRRSARHRKTSEVICLDSD